MDMDLATIAFKQPHELLARLERDARGHLRDEASRLVAWDQARELAQERKRQLEGLKQALQQAAEDLENAEARQLSARAELAAAEKALREAREEDRKVREGRASVPMQVGGVHGAPIPMQQGGVFIRPERPRSLASAELRLEGARGKLRQVDGDVGLAQSQHRDSRDRVQACQRHRAAFEDQARPETPALDKLWSLMEGEHGSSKKS